VEVAATSAVAPGSPALAGADLYRFFHAGDDEVLALKGVSIEVAAGELVVVIGPSGSGKSTLLACLAGLDEPDGGTVRVAGHTITRRPEPERAALRARFVGMLFQSWNLLGHLNVEDNLRLAQRLAGDDVPARRTALLERLGLTRRARALPAQLSGGEAVRAGLAVALANDPAVLIADEPTAEVDGASERAVLRVLHEELDAGRALLVASHSETVAASATRVVHLVDGRAVA
jgi:putative ABC transport system ATP-binding protein